MSDDHEYDEHGWIILRSPNGQVFHVHPDILPMLQKQADGKVAQMGTTIDDTGKKTISFMGIPLNDSDVRTAP